MDRVGRGVRDLLSAAATQPQMAVNRMAVFKLLFAELLRTNAFQLGDNAVSGNSSSI
jgi:hypothetical protein